MTKELQKGDFGFDLNFTAADQSGTELNLSGGSVWFKMGLANTNVTSLSGACTIDVAASGTCHYTVGSNDLGSIGTYQWELESIFGTTKKITTSRTENIVIKNNLN